MPRAAPTSAGRLPTTEPILAMLPSAAGAFLPWLDEAPRTELAGAVALVRVEGALAENARLTHHIVIAKALRLRARRRRCLRCGGADGEGR